MGNVRIELNSSGIRELLKSEEIAAFCEEEARAMTEAAGVKYVSDVYYGETRVNARGYKTIEDGDSK